MLEMEGKLRTWRLERLPAPGVGIRAEPLGDHRIAYLDYEGPVSGGRGSVTRWDAGEFERGKNEPGEIFVGLREAEQGLDCRARVQCENLEKRPPMLFTRQSVRVSR